MIIAQVCPRYYPYLGGVETYVREISERLAKRGLQVEVLTTETSGTLPREELISDVKVRRFRSWAPNELCYFSTELKEYLTKHSDMYDIVHAHSYHDIPSMYAAQTKHGNKLVLNPFYHGTGHTWFTKLLHRPYRLFGKKIFQKADRVVCVSEYEKRLVLEHFGSSAERAVVIPCGVNREELGRLRKRKKAYVSLLYAGRLEKYKGLEYLIKVLPKLSSKVILNIDGNGPYKKRLLELTSTMKVADRVRFFESPRQELLDKYAEADLFVSLSKSESYGIGVAEALASGTPCVVANTSALKEWVDGTNCFGIDYPIDLGVLADLIENVAGREVSNLQTSKLCDWRDTAGQLAEVYNELA